MKKNYIFLVFIICMWCGFAENVYYVEKDGTILNLGKSENTHVIEDSNMLVNNGKVYINGKESIEEGEKYKQAVMKSTAYIFRDKISDDVWTSWPENSYVVRIYNEDEPYIVLKDLKIFGELNETTGPYLYSGYLVLKDNKMYFGYDLTSFSEENKINTNNIDVESIEQIGNNYFKDKNGIYSFVNNGDFSKKEKFLKVKNADERTFQVLDENYARDSHNIYYKDKILSVKDKEEFQILKLRTHEHDVYAIGWSKDGIYFEGKKISNEPLKGKAENVEKTIFKDSNGVYRFDVDYNNPKVSVKKLNIPVDAKCLDVRYTEWILEDDKYVYNPYSDKKTAKFPDFKWLNTVDLFRNGGKIYFISPMYGITELGYDSDTFRMVYSEDNLTEIISDKNGYYFHDRESFQFKKLKNEKIKLLDNTENVMGNIFYNSENKKYYMLLDAYRGNVGELTGIKNVSEVLLDYYIIGN